MLPAANAVSTVAKPVSTLPGIETARTPEAKPAETARSSAGETPSAQLRGETVHAAKAVEQSAVAPRLRDNETSERSDRAQPSGDAPAGPPPAFEESPLERQARVVFDPPEPDRTEDTKTAEEQTPAPTDGSENSLQAQDDAISGTEPPPTPTERAETSFAETQSLAEPKAPSSVDVAR